MGVIEDKDLEITTLLNFGIFNEVEDVGQERMMRQWIVMEKEKHDEMRTKVKACIVSCRFQEDK